MKARENDHGITYSCSIALLNTKALRVVIVVMDVEEDEVLATGGSNPRRRGCSVSSPIHKLTPSTIIGVACRTLVPITRKHFPIRSTSHHTIEIPSSSYHQDIIIRIIIIIIIIRYTIVPLCHYTIVPLKVFRS